MTDAEFNAAWMKLGHTIENIANEFDAKWIQRKRSCDSLLLVNLILQVSFAKNSRGYATTILDSWQKLQQAIPRLRWRRPLAASSFCEARNKLDESIFKKINDAVIDEMEKTKEVEKWEGHRLFCIDGTRVNLPREFFKLGYKSPTEKSHYPQGLVSTLYNLKSRMPYDFNLKDNFNEREAALEHLNKLKKNDLVIYDRGYFSYELLLEHAQRDIAAVFRIKSKQNINAIQRFIDQSRKLSEVIQIRPEERYGRRLRSKLALSELPKLSVRVVKYRCENQCFYLATTLVDEKYSVEKLNSLYFSRWGIEEFYKVIKRITMVEEFRGKTKRKVLQELYAHMLISTISRTFSNQVEEQIPITQKKSYKKGYIKKKTSKVILSGSTSSIVSMER